MQLIRERPPLFDEIAAVFDVKGKPVLFAWGDAIYAPSGVSTVAPQLLAHEAVHGRRQKVFSYSLMRMGFDDQMTDLDPDREHAITGWWRKYISDPAFRLAEEIPAHIAEYKNLCERLPSRSDRRRHLSLVAGRLASPLYRYSISKDEARKVLEDGNF